MARPYADEMTQLQRTFEWAATTDISALSDCVRRSSPFPLRAVGSGGSLTAAHALAGLHQRLACQAATVATPLEVTTQPLAQGAAAWLLSAGGRNVDVLKAARAEIQREPRQLVVLTGADTGPLADLCRNHSYVDLLTFSMPAGRDGFLATNSLLAFVALLTRSFELQYGDSTSWDESAGHVRRTLTSAPTLADWQARTAHLWEADTLIVLHGPSTLVAAVDIESKFTEAALANVQIADYRNFAHGRHHWLAKRARTTAVLALATDSDRDLARRTMRLMPKDVPAAQLELDGSVSAVGLQGLIAVLWLTGWAGTARGIDPGQPGVPEFGRRLYNLANWTVRTTSTTSTLTGRTAAAIRRKSGTSIPQLEKRNELPRWLAALSQFRRGLHASHFGAVLLDYDGTLVDTRKRFSVPQAEVSRELTRLLAAKGRVAIATGRGSSARRDLQRCLAHQHWPAVVMGYYNGAEISTLDDDSVPDGSSAPGEDLKDLANLMRQDPALVRMAHQSDRRFQITLAAKAGCSEDELWDSVFEVVRSTRAAVSVSRSTHSIDVLPTGVTKLNVLRRLREHLGEVPLLTIGDRGRWPGNDFELLDSPHSISVDEVSSDPSRCWNLALPGQRGPAVTIDYLSSLSVQGDHLRVGRRL